jgi:mitochondrial fission protein ELM1
MKKNVWILLDNRIGSRHQAEGIAHYLDTNKFNVIEKEIEYNKWSALPNLLRGNTLIGTTKKTKQTINNSFPDIVLSSSRRTAPIARWIKKQSPQTKLIQLLHIGKTGIKDFSLIFVPEHDQHKFKAENIIYTIGSPHFVTDEKLATAKTEWMEQFSHLPKPITALIIGGSIKKHPFSLDNALQLAQATKQLKEKEGGSLLITTSRRTGVEAQNLIMENLKDIPHYAYLWGAEGKNPYLGFLSCADNLIVTGDSVSMCCEATATQKPLRIFTGSNWLTDKHIRFVQSLYQQKVAQDIFSQESSVTQQTKLNIAKEIADKISEL